MKSESQDDHLELGEKHVHRVLLTFWMLLYIDSQFAFKHAPASDNKHTSRHRDVGNTFQKNGSFLQDTVVLAFGQAWNAPGRVDPTAGG